MFQRIVVNLGTAQKRYETLEGKTHLVVPVVMLTEGVHSGTQGPLYYPPSELAKNPLVWNHKPVVIYHPTLNGQGISACDPLVVERQKTGLLFNTTYDGRLKSEVWFDEPKLKRVDVRVWNAIQKGEMMEVSTGLFHDPEMIPGVWNGESYVGTVRNIQPDHLAVLPDEIGACSVADGAGLLRNADSDGTLSYEDTRDQLRSLVHKHKPEGMQPHEDPYHRIVDVFPRHVVYERAGSSQDGLYRVGYKIRQGKVSLDGDHARVHRQTNYVMATTHAGDAATLPTHRQMQSALEDYHGQGLSWTGWVRYVDDSNVHWTAPDGNFSLPYSRQGGNIQFSGQPQKVDRVIQPDPPTEKEKDPMVTPASPAQVPGNPPAQPALNVQPANNTIHQGAAALFPSAPAQPQSPGSARPDSIKALMSGGLFSENDRAWLEGMTDEQFGKVLAAVSRGANQPTGSNEYGYEGVKDRSNVHTLSQQPQPNTNQTVTDYIRTAPPEVQQMLLDGLAAHNEEKNRLIATITANQSNVFDPRYLNGLPVSMLRGMAALAGQQQQQVRAQPIGNGQADIPMFLPPRTDNRATVQEPPALAIPQMDFKSKS